MQCTACGAALLAGASESLRDVRVKKGKRQAEREGGGGREAERGREWEGERGRDRESEREMQPGPLQGAVN